tara:strand:+ start:1721 stop:2068 length:348 start_codon:yes stop_codon:yes gene_type:complete
MLSNNIKIILSLVSTLIIYLITNYSNKMEHEKLNIINFFIHEKEGFVCPFGVWCGRLMIILCIIQIYYLYKNNYENIKKYNFILLIIGFIFSFMNFYVLKNIILAFIMQLLIIFL